MTEVRHLVTVYDIDSKKDLVYDTTTYTPVLEAPEAGWTYEDKLELEQAATDQNLQFVRTHKGEVWRIALYQFNKKTITLNDPAHHHKVGVNASSTKRSSPSARAGTTATNTPTPTLPGRRMNQQTRRPRTRIVPTPCYPHPAHTGGFIALPPLTSRRGTQTVTPKQPQKAPPPTNSQNTNFASP